MHKLLSKRKTIEYVVLDRMRNTLCVQPIYTTGSVGIRAALNFKNIFYGNENKRFELIGKI